MTYNVGDTVTVKFAGEAIESTIVIESIAWDRCEMFGNDTFAAIINGREIYSNWYTQRFAGCPYAA